MHKTIILGSEHDKAIWLALKSVLTEMRGTIQDSSWGVGGSQELTSFEVIVDGRNIKIESETYVGISLSGDSDLVDQIKSEMISHVSLNNTQK